MVRLRELAGELKVFPLAMGLGAFWGFFSPIQGILLDLLWPLFSLLVVVYFVSLWLLAALEAGGPGLEGHLQPGLEWAARWVSLLGPTFTLLALFWGSPGTVVVAYSAYYAGIQFLSEYRLTWLTFAAGWFCVLGLSPAVSAWEAVLLYPLVAFVTVGGLRGLLADEGGLRRTCR